MLCPYYGREARPFGFNRNGSRRYRCPRCIRTCTDERTRPADRRQLSRDKTILVLRLVLEGNSVRSAERLTDVHRDTIIATMVEAGEFCQRFMRSVIQRVPVRDVQCDEVWGFVGCKEKTRQRKGYGEDMGDAYCFTAIERHTKLLLAWHLGKRTAVDADVFAIKLARATLGRFQLTTDGFRPYLPAILHTLGHRVDYAMLVKVYGRAEDERAYSPPEVIDVVATPRIGQPDAGRICTSHVERHNKTIRMAVRRMTRLTDAHSKKWDNHEAALALFFAYYNFCRVHSTIKMTPAVATG